MFFKNKFLILTYHRVLIASDPLMPGQTDAAMFKQHAKALAAGFNVLNLDDAAIRLKQGTLPNRAVVITFDDGYRDNATVALPILKENNLTATFFIASGFLDGGRMWNDTVIESIRACQRDELDLDHLGLGRLRLETLNNRREAINQLLGQIKYMDSAIREECTEKIESSVGADLPTDLMMSSDQVRTLAMQGMQIGAHTVSHPILSCIDAASAKKEIEQGRNRLTDMIGRSITSFAYPNGRFGTDYNQIHVDMIRDLGFSVGVSTAHGCVTRQCDMLQLPRMTSWDKTRLRFTLRLLKSYFVPEAVRAE